jgi:hypothetical protein
MQIDLLRDFNAELRSFDMTDEHTAIDGPTARPSLLRGVVRRAGAGRVKSSARGCHPHDGTELLQARRGREIDGERISNDALSSCQDLNITTPGFV